MGDGVEQPEAGGANQPETCLNCGAALVGNYCHACGQKGHIHRTLTSFSHDLLHGTFHFEGKIWRTLPMLAWRPGDLTRRYVEGQRARFVSPIALFLFSVFLMFAVLSLTGRINPADRPEVASALSSDARKGEAKLAGLEQARAKLAAAGQSTAAIDASISDARDKITVLRPMDEGGVISAPSGLTISDNIPAWIREPAERAGKNPELLLYKLRNNAYKWSWALIPLSVPFLWLLFPFSRRFRLYDHVVFVTYSISFMTLLVVAASLLSAAGVAGAVAVAMFIPPIHMFRQLKGAYGLSNPGALWRTILLTLFAILAAVLFVVLITGLGVFD